MQDSQDNKIRLKLGRCPDKFIHFPKDSQRKLIEQVDGVQFLSIISFNSLKLKDLP